MLSKCAGDFRPVLPSKKQPVQNIVGNVAVSIRSLDWGNQDWLAYDPSTADADDKAVCSALSFFLG